MKEPASPSALAAAASALHQLRSRVDLAPRGAEDFDRLRAVLTGGHTVLHRGETVMTLVRSLEAWARAALSPVVAEMLLTIDLSEADWRRAFEAVEAVGTPCGACAGRGLLPADAAGIDYILSLGPGKVGDGLPNRCRACGGSGLVSAASLPDDAPTPIAQRDYAADALLHGSPAGVPGGR